MNKDAEYQARYHAKNKVKRLAANKAWRQANTERRRNYAVAYRAANLEKLRAREKARDKVKQAAKNAAWRKKNAAHDIARKAKWYALNQDKSRKRTAAWVKLHPENAAASTARRRARMAAVVLTHEEQATVVALYAKARALTELTGVPYHVDHKKPLSKGGLHHPDNLQVLLGRENLRKGNRYE